ncbi:unnamed protein product, partial [Ascophyllum nodosum]
ETESEIYGCGPQRYPHRNSARSTARHEGEDSTGASTVSRRRGQGGAQERMSGAGGIFPFQADVDGFCTLTVRGSRSREELYHLKQTSG